MRQKSESQDGGNKKKKAHQIFPKTNISDPLIHTRTKEKQQKCSQKNSPNTHGIEKKGYHFSRKIFTKSVQKAIRIILYLHALLSVKITSMALYLEKLSQMLKIDQNKWIQKCADLLNAILLLHSFAF